MFEESRDPDQPSSSEHSMKGHPTSSSRFLKEDTLAENISLSQLKCDENEFKGFSSAKGQKISISNEALGIVCTLYSIKICP